MELEKVQNLVDMMKANDLTELEIVDGQTRIVLKRGGDQLTPQVVAMTPTLAVNGTVPVASESKTSKTESSQDQPDTKHKKIVSPIVGTLYTAPSPNADPFVEVGSEVEEDTVVCIIEAMKVMNEIKSEVKGTIKEILVSDGAAVEYGQPLFLVEPK